LPTSVQALLRYDQDLAFGSRPFFAEMLEHRTGDVVRSQTITTHLRMAFADYDEDERPADLQWCDGPNMPGLVEFPLGADQRVFLYMGKPDEAGEFPMARFDDQPEVWLTSSCLANEVLGSEVGLKKSERRNKATLTREWLVASPD